MGIRVFVACLLGLLLVASPDVAGSPLPQAGSAPGEAPGPQKGPKKDPEESPDGRETYLGRRIARTMSWQGAPWLVRGSREEEENGRLLRAWLDVQPGNRVADFGCGNGYHTLPLAKAVGPKGQVYAVDLQPEMLDLLGKRVAEESAGLGTELNVEPILSTVRDAKLPRESCDYVLLVDVYHELSHPVSVLRGLRESLTPGGVIVLVEYRAEDRSVPIKLLHKMSKAQVIAEMAANGLRLAAESNDLPWQHAMAFERVPAPKEGEPEVPLVRQEAEAMARGFLDALHLGDPRVVEPFLADRVALDSTSETESSKGLAVQLGKAMRASEAPLSPADIRVDMMTVGGTGLLAAAQLTAPEGATLYEGRSLLELRRDQDGIFRVAGWLAHQ